MSDEKTEQFKIISTIAVHNNNEVSLTESGYSDWKSFRKENSADNEVKQYNNKALCEMIFESSRNRQ